jgi:hypothetical protein
MTFNKVITDILHMYNTRISVKYQSDDTLDVRVDDIYMGTIVYSDSSVFYQDFITEGKRDLARRDCFLDKVIHERILRLKDPRIYGGYMRNIYKITGVMK